jgi:hypothetical protein
MHKSMSRDRAITVSDVVGPQLDRVQQNWANVFFLVVGDVVGQLVFKKTGLTFSFSFARALHTLSPGKKPEHRQPSGDFSRPWRDPPVRPIAQPAGALGPA